MVRHEWADQGRKATARYFVPDEKPVTTRVGCAVIRADLNAEGKPLKTACFDVNGRQVATRTR